MLKVLFNKIDTYKKHFNDISTKLLSKCDWLQSVGLPTQCVCVCVCLCKVDTVLSVHHVCRCVPNIYTFYQIYLVATELVVYMHITNTEYSIGYTAQLLIAIQISASMSVTVWRWLCSNKYHRSISIHPCSSRGRVTRKIYQCIAHFSQTQIKTTVTPHAYTTNLTPQTRLSQKKSWNNNWKIQNLKQGKWS